MSRRMVAVIRQLTRRRFLLQILEKYSTDKQGNCSAKGIAEVISSAHRAEKVALSTPNA